MVKGKIWGEFNGEYHEIEIEECNVIVAIGLKNKGDMIGSQVSSLGGGLTRWRSSSRSGNRGVPGGKEKPGMDTGR